MHDYASPFDPASPALHGRWHRDQIRPERFEDRSAEEADAITKGWADNPARICCRRINLMSPSPSVCSGPSGHGRIGRISTPRVRRCRQIVVWPTPNSRAIFFRPMPCS